MKLIVLAIMMLSLASCGQETSGGVFYTSSTSYNVPFIIVGGDIAFACVETYQNGYGNITTNATNTSSNYEYSFDYEIQLWQYGMIVQSSGVYSCLSLMPQQTQKTANVMTDQVYDPQFVKIVISNVRKIPLTFAN